MLGTPHGDKLIAAISNPKSSQDVLLLNEAKALYDIWLNKTISLTTRGKDRVVEMTSLLNEYKDTLEVELILKRGSDFLKRQKGQLKLDNSIIEEFMGHLIIPAIIEGLGDTSFVTGPQNAFMSLSFMPLGFTTLDLKPEVVIKSKDQDFVVGSQVHYKFAPTNEFKPEHTKTGSLIVPVIAAECKVNLDKTMFQEAAGTAARLKHGCPIAKYFLIIEYLDMSPEDSRLTEIDNVFLLRHAKRLPFDKRQVVAEVERQRREHPIDSELIWKFVQEIQSLVSTSWFDPEEAIRRGSFV